MIHLHSLSVFAQDELTVKPDNKVKSKRSGKHSGDGKDLKEGVSENDDFVKEFNALLSYNFSGNAKGLEKLTPIIDYGWTTRLINRGKFSWDLAINPYVAGQIDITEKDSYMPGLMLPGSAGIKVNNYLTIKLYDAADKKEGRLTLSPLNFGYKIISNFADTITSLAQHNFRPGIAFQHGDLFIIGAQYSLAWHNSTSASQKGFEKVFERNSTDLHYLTISLQTKISSKDSDSDQKISAYLFAEWRGIVGDSRDRFEAFDNQRIITFGIRSTLNLENAFPSSRPFSN